MYDCGQSSVCPGGLAAVGSPAGMLQGDVGALQGQSPSSPPLGRSAGGSSWLEKAAACRQGWAHAEMPILWLPEARTGESHLCQGSHRQHRAGSRFSHASPVALNQPGHSSCAAGNVLFSQPVVSPCSSGCLVMSSREREKKNSSIPSQKVLIPRKNRWGRTEEPHQIRHT